MSIFLTTSIRARLVKLGIVEWSKRQRFMAPSDRRDGHKIDKKLLCKGECSNVVMESYVSVK